jgi:hypothetical protein
VVPIRWDVDSDHKYSARFGTMQCIITRIKAELPIRTPVSDRYRSFWCVATSMLSNRWRANGLSPVDGLRRVLWNQRMPTDGDTVPSKVRKR